MINPFAFVERRLAPVLPGLSAGAGAVLGLARVSPLVAMGAAPALVLSAALDLRGGRIREKSGIESLGLECLAAIGFFEREEGSTFPTADCRAALEAYRSLATAVRERLNPPRTILVTSSLPKEGTSTTAANLAIMLAKTGSKVVLVDADLRFPSLRCLERGVQSGGLSGLLCKYLLDPQFAVVRTAERNLFLLPAGAPPKDIPEILRSPRLLEIVVSLREMADYVVFNTPSLVEAPDASILGLDVDATLLVVEAGKTRKRAVGRALRALREAGIQPHGAVLNRARIEFAAEEPEIEYEAPVPLRRQAALSVAVPPPASSAAPELLSPMAPAGDDASPRYSQAPRLRLVYPLEVPESAEDEPR